MPIIEVEGIGRVEFPEGMSDDQISEAIYSNYPELKPQQAMPEFDATAGLAPELEPQSFTEATGAALSNVPERFQQSAAGLVQMLGESMDETRLARMESTSKKLGISTGDYQLLAWAGNEGLVDPKTPIPEALEYIKKNITGSLDDEQLSQVADMGLINPEEMTRYSKEWREETQATMEPVNPEPDSAAYYGSAAIGSLAEMGPALLAGIVTRNPTVTMGIMMPQVEGQTYAEARELGLSIDEAQLYATANAAAEAIPEYIPVQAILKPGVNFFKKILKGGLAESAQETLTEAIQIAIDKDMIDPDMTWEEARSRMIDAGIIGGLTGTGMGATAGAYQKGFEVAEQKLAPGRVMGREMEQQLAQTEFVDNAGDIAKQSLSPEMAQIKATPQADKSVAMLVKEKLFDQGVDLTVPMDAIPTQPEAKIQEQAPAEEIKQDVTLDKPSTPTERDQRERGDTDKPDSKPAGKPRKEVDKPADQPAPSSKTDKPLADEGIQQPDTLKSSSIRKKYHSFIYKNNKTVLNKDLTINEQAVYEGNFVNSITDKEIKELDNQDWHESVSIPLNLTDAQKVINKVNKSNLYHGSPDTELSSLKRMSSGGLFLSFDKKGAEHYSEGGKVYDQRVKISNPLFVESSDLTADMESSDEINNLIKLGYDSIVPLDYGDIVILSDKAILKKKPIKKKLDLPSTDEVTKALDKGETRLSRQYKSSIGKKYPNVKLSFSSRQDAITIDMIVVPEKERYSGLGTKVMNEIITKADKAGHTIDLTPTTEFGSSKARLINFYKKLGFVLNKGKNKDFEISGSMYRLPKKKPEQGVLFSKTPKKPVASKPKDEKRNFAPLVLKAVKESGFTKSITPEGNVQVFHGTSEANIKNIIKTGKFKGYPFFALDRETAEKFSKQAGGKSKVIELTVDPDIVIPTGGYFTARIEGLSLQENNVWSVAVKKDDTIEYSRSPKAKKHEAKVDGVVYRKNFTPKGMEALEVSNKDNKPMTEDQTLDKVEKLQNDGPMPNNPPMYSELEAKGEMPARKEFFHLRGKKIKNGSEYNPQKREGIITHVKSIIGNRLYTNRIKSKSVGGFYNAVNGETRLKRYGDIEVLAHEMAHYLDFYHKFDASTGGKQYQRTRGKTTRKESEISSMYSHGTNAKEVESFSYTSKDSLILSEGFAEYVRAWLTNYDFAKKKAPNFTKEFETYLKKDKKFERKMLGLQIKMHKWFLQGDKARLIEAISGERDQSKSLTAGEKIMRLRSLEVGAELKQFTLDYLHAAKVMSRTVKGKLDIGIAEPYKLLQLLHGADQIFAESYLRGAPYYKEDGSIGFKGMSLNKVWGESKKAGNERMKDQEAYFAAKRAVEATKKGTEKLFTQGMINEGLALGKKHPYFVKAFADFQLFNEQMLQFYVDSGYISQDAMNAFIGNNQAYVAFHRAISSRTSGGAGSDISARQTGGEESILHIYENTIRQTGIHMAAALKERAIRGLIVQTLGQGTKGEGGQFLTRATTDVQRITIDVEQIADSILQKGTVNEINIKDLGFQGELGLIVTRRDFIAYLEANPHLIKFWTFGHAPKDKKTDFISYIEEGTGTTKWVQINEDNSLLPSMLDALNGIHLPQNKVVKSLLVLPIYFKNIKTVFITSAWQFAGGNIFRDSATAMALSNFKFKPVYHHLIGLGHMIESVWNDNGLVGELRGNGGYSGGRTKSVMYENWGLTGSNSEYLAEKDWYRSPLRIAKEIALTYAKVADVSEMATRVGFYYAARKSGVDPVEAAWQTRQITTDFQKRGANPHLAYAVRTSHFLNAGMQGFSREMEAIFEVNGEMKLSNWYKDENGRITLASVKTKMYGAMMMITGLSMMSAYLMLNSDDEDDKNLYKNLTPDERARFMFWPGGYRTPKPIGVFGFAATLGDIGINNHIDPKENKEFLADEALFAAGYHMVVMGKPAIAELPLDLISGTDWKGAPIVPEKLKDVMAFEQYNSRTGLGYVELSRSLKDNFNISLSPIKTEYVVKSTMGYYSEYIKEYSDRLFWDYENWGERPFQKTFEEISFRQFKKDERVYRNKYTSKYYELYHEAIQAASSWRIAIEHAEQIGDKSYEKNYGEYEHALIEIQSEMQSVTKAYNEWQQGVLMGNRNPKLSAKQKEDAEVERLKSKNVILESSYKQFRNILDDIKKKAEKLNQEKK